MTLYRLVGRPPEDFDEPVLVVCMDGWIDAGGGAATALEHLLSVVPTEVFAVFDGDALLDYRARRPTIRVADGIHGGLTWPEIQLRTGHDRAGRALLVLRGPEPDFRWREFAAAVVTLAREFGAPLLCALGAFPAPVPHTRPVRLASTATTRRLADQVGFVEGTIEVPAGIAAALEDACREAGIEAVGLWARVPHYVAAMPYPAASAALLEGLASTAGLTLDVRELQATAALHDARIDELIANSEEHTALVRQLEEAVDSTEGPPLDPAHLPSGDELAAELERFLRGEL